MPSSDAADQTHDQSHEPDPPVAGPAGHPTGDVTGDLTGDLAGDLTGDLTGHLTGDLTGHPDVDEVLATLDGLPELPLAEHVAVLERAHERLRGVLDEPPSGPPADLSGSGAPSPSGV